jgi:glucan phosphoethanolaminetransferase (alkaline phosphatase superfamily)
MITPQNDDEIRRKEKRIVRFKLTYPGFIALFALFLTAIILFYLGFKNVANIFPLIIVFSGIIIITFGALYDFGANKYIDNVMTSKMSIRENDIVQINKEQLIMTLIYGGLGGLFILFGVLLFYTLNVI